jgi:hypothetical protein
MRIAGKAREKKMVAAPIGTLVRLHLEETMQNDTPLCPDSLRPRRGIFQDKRWPLGAGFCADGKEPASPAFMLHVRAQVYEKDLKRKEAAVQKPNDLHENAEQ